MTVERESKDGGELERVERRRLRIYRVFQNEGNGYDEEEVSVEDRVRVGELLEVAVTVSMRERER